MPREASPKARALAYLQTVLDDPGALRSDRQRAAEAILRAEPQALKGLRGATAALTDAELEAAARGEGGTPPERGPATGVTETGPIRERSSIFGAPTPFPQRDPPGRLRQGAPPPGLREKGPIAGGPRPGTPPPGPPAAAPRGRRAKMKPGKTENETSILPPEHDPLS